MSHSLVTLHWQLLFLRPKVKSPQHITAIMMLLFSIGVTIISCIEYNGLLIVRISRFRRLLIKLFICYTNFKQIV